MNQAKTADQAALNQATAQINAIVTQITTQAAAQQASDDLSLTQTQQVISSAQQKLNVIINTASQSKATIQAAASKDLATQQAKMAAGKAQHERDWKTALLKTFGTVDSETANAAQGHLLRLHRVAMLEYRSGSGCRCPAGGVERS